MPQQFAIGDVHGCSRTLQKLLSALQPQKGDGLFFVGDYIDRGPDSKGVVDIILSLKQQGIEVTTIRGNHEQMMLESENGLSQFQLWTRNGGTTTLDSFGIQRYSQLSDPYRKFFENTQLYAATDKFIVVHAGLNLREADIYADTYAMLWMRGCKGDLRKTGGKTIIFGHTPTSIEIILQQEITKGILNIDGGCVYDQVPGLGHLVAYDLIRNEFTYVANCE